jgi:hypothetical protein
MTVANKPGHRGEYEAAVKTIACGNAGCSGATVVTNACAFYHCARGCGCNGHPAFPAPSDFKAKDMHNSGVSRREIAELHLAVICFQSLTYTLNSA